jgi:hypothetical protein
MALYPAYRRPGSRLYLSFLDFLRLRSLSGFIFASAGGFQAAYPLPPGLDDNNHPSVQLP